MSELAVVIVFSHRANLLSHEKIALQQCVRVLGSHPIHVVSPHGLDTSEHRRIAPDAKYDTVPAIWLSSYYAYNRMKMSPWFYRRYAEFQFMLTYELDCFVFRDELTQWCDRGWDYIGAPWFEGHQHATRSAPLIGVGNSGFSLRRVHSLLRVLNTWRTIEPTGQIVARFINERSAGRWHQHARSLALQVVCNNFHWPLNLRARNEDHFWAEDVPKKFPEFRVAPITEAMRFSFEVNPSRLFEICGDTLPFGCHNWRKYEPEFWTRHIAESNVAAPAAASSEAR